MSDAVDVLHGGVMPETDIESVEVEGDMPSTQRKVDIAIIQDLLDGAYEILKDESILNDCKKEGSCIVTSQYMIVCSDLKTPFINVLMDRVKQHMEENDVPPVDIVVRIASKKAIDAVLARPNNILLADSEGGLDSLYSVMKDSDEQATTEMDTLLYEIRQAKVADIHIMATTDESVVLVRNQLGVVRHYAQSREAEYGLRVGSLIFGTLASEGSNGTFLPSEANNSTFSWTVDGKDCRFRANTIPIRNGCCIVIRSLEAATEHVPTLEELGFLPAQISMLMKIILSPFGSLLITGQTGSGKTTTLASLVNAIPTNKRIHSLEDPIELVLGNATQTEINVSGDEDNLGTKIGSFAYFGRQLLRQDIDVGIFGELRDKLAVQVFYHLATTGHLLMGTMHVSSAAGVPNQLMNIYGLKPLQVADADAFKAFMHQKLANRVCPNCGVSHQERKTILASKGADLSKLTEAERFQLAETQSQFDLGEKLFAKNILNLRYRNEKGCSVCEFTGYSGKTALAEILVLDDEIRGFIEREETSQMVTHMKSKGFPTVRDHAFHCIRKGMIDIHEATRVIGDLDIDNQKSYDYSNLISELSGTM